MVNLSTGLTALTSSSFVLSSFKCIYSVVFSKLKQSQIQAWWKGNRGPFLYTLPQDLPLHSMTKTNRVKRKEQNSCWLARKGNDIQGSRLTFQLSSLVASERFDFTSQNTFSLARLFFA